LTEDEYISEGAIETRRALVELRKYCQSPDCNAWKTVSRLSSPSQFAEFVSGNRSHISDDEILRYSDQRETDDDQRDDDDEENLSENGDSEDERDSKASDGSFGNYDLRRRNGRYQEFGRQSITMSAPPRSRNGQFVSRINNYSFTGRL